MNFKKGAHSFLKLPRSYSGWWGWLTGILGLMWPLCWLWFRLRVARGVHLSYCYHFNSQPLSLSCTFYFPKEKQKQKVSNSQARRMNRGVGSLVGEGRWGRSQKNRGNTGAQEAPAIRNSMPWSKAGRGNGSRGWRWGWGEVRGRVARGVGGEPWEPGLGPREGGGSRANACDGNESVLFLLPTTLLKDGEDSQHQTGDAFLGGVGLSLESSPATRMGLGSGSRDGAGRTQDVEEEESGERRGGCPPAGATWRPNLSSAHRRSCQAAGGSALARWRRSGFASEHSPGRFPCAVGSTLNSTKRWNKEVRVFGFGDKMERGPCAAGVAAKTQGSFQEPSRLPTAL